MSDILEPVIEGQVPEPAQDADNGAELAKLRAEAAKWRTQYREAQKMLTDLQPAAQRLAELENQQKTEAEKLADKVRQLEAQAAAAQEAAAQAARERQFLTLAVKAGVPSQIVDYLNPARFDLDDEDATTKALGELMTALKARPPQTSASNPGRDGTMTNQQMHDWLFGNSAVNKIFGGS